MIFRNQELAQARQRIAELEEERQRLLNYILEQAGQKRLFVVADKEPSLPPPQIPLASQASLQTEVDPPVRAAVPAEPRQLTAVEVVDRAMAHRNKLHGVSR